MDDLMKCLYDFVLERRMGDWYQTRSTGKPAILWRCR